MIKQLIPIILILTFGGAGVAAGLMLKPEEVAMLDAENPCGEDPNKGGEAAKGESKPTKDGTEKYEYAKLNNQFIVPVIKVDIVRSVVVVALSLEVTAGSRDAVFAIEPKLRDSFLQALFDHASRGGFDGAFANTENLIRMRRALKENATKILGDVVNDVLVTDIERQDN